MAARLGAWADRLGPLRQWFLIFAVLLAIYLPTATRDLRVHVDAAMSALPAYTVAEHGTLDLAPVEDLVVNQKVARGQSVVVGEHRYSNRNPGAIAIGIPAYAAKRWLLGPGGFSTVPAAVTAAVVVAAAVATLSLALREAMSSRHAVGFSLVVGLTTPTWSVSADSTWSHGANQLWLAVALLMMARRAYARSGLAFGVAIFTRPYSAAAAAVSGIYLSAKRRGWRPVVLIGVGSAAGMLAFLLYTRSVFGVWSVFGGYTDLGYHARSLQSTDPSYAADLAWSIVSPSRGILLHSAWILPLILGIRKAWAVAPDWIKAAALSGVAYWLLQIRASSFQGDFFFGYRYQLEAVWLAAPLFALAWREHVREDPMLNRIFMALLIAAVTLQVLGAAFEIYKY